MKKDSKQKCQNRLLYRYFDGQLSEAEEKEFKQSLESSDELRREYIHFKKLRTLLKENTVTEFEPLFADRILLKIEEEQEESFFSMFQLSFRRVALAGTISIFLLLANNILTSGEFSLEGALGMPSLSLEDTISLNHLIGSE